MTLAEYGKAQTALIKYERECVENAEREIKERMLLMAKEAFLQGFVDRNALADGLDAVYHKYRGMAADKASEVAEQYLDDVLQESGLKHVYEKPASGAGKTGDWYATPDGMRVFVSEARRLAFLEHYQLSADTAPISSRALHEETAREMEEQVFAVIEGAKALGRGKEDIKGDLIALVQFGGKRVVERWAQAMDPYNADGSRNEKRIKEAWEREYILAVANEDKSPDDEGWITYPSREADELLREPYAQAWLRQESIGASGRQLLPPGAKRGLNKNERVILKLLFPQIDKRDLMMNDRYGDPTDTVSWEEHMRRKRRGWESYAKKVLDTKDPTYQEIRLVRTESAKNYNARQRSIAEESVCGTGKVTRKLAARRDAWGCKCEEAAAWINAGGGKTPAEILQHDLEHPDEKYSAPLHPNCDCTDVPRMRDMKEVREELFEKYFGDTSAPMPEPLYEPHVKVNPTPADYSYKYDTSDYGESIDPNLFVMGAYVKKEQAKSNAFFAEHVLNNPQAQAAVKTYTNDKNGTGHRDINNAQLGKIPMTPAIERDVKELQKLTEMYKLDEDITVYRGVPAEYLSGLWEIGKPESPKMFTSSSANMLTAWGFAKEKPRPILMEIRVAKGTKGVYIGDNTFFEKGGKKKNEREFLLGNDVKYTVISKKNMGSWESWIVEAQ
jgi:hypothetical protein